MLTLLFIITVITFFVGASSHTANLRKFLNNEIFNRISKKAWSDFAYSVRVEWIAQIGRKLLKEARKAAEEAKKTPKEKEEARKKAEDERDKWRKKGKF